MFIIVNHEQVEQSVRSTEHFRQYFEKQGVRFTEGYLSGFTGFRRFLAEHSPFSIHNEYEGAKRFLASINKSSKGEIT